MKRLSILLSILVIAGLLLSACTATMVPAAAPACRTYSGRR